jgi:hypothetical protein
MFINMIAPPSVALRGAKLARFFEKKRLEMRFTKFFQGVTLSKFENKNAQINLVFPFIFIVCRSKQNKDKDETKQEKNQQRIREGYR